MCVRAAVTVDLAKYCNRGVVDTAKIIEYGFKNSGFAIER